MKFNQQKILNQIKAEYDPSILSPHIIVIGFADGEVVEGLSIEAIEKIIAQGEQEIIVWRLRPCLWQDDGDNVSLYVFPAAPPMDLANVFFSRPKLDSWIGKGW